MEQRYGDFIIRLANGITLRRLYFDGHPRVAETSRDVAADLAALLREGGGPLTIGVHGGKFVRDGHYLVGPSIAGRALVDFAERLGCGGFNFATPLTPGEIVSFFRLGAERGEACDRLADAQVLFAREGLAHVGLTPPMADETLDGSQPDEPPADDEAGRAPIDFAPLVDVYQDMYDTVSTNALAVGRSGSVDIQRAMAAGTTLVELTGQGSLDVMQFLRYPDYDSYTIGHSVRVAALAALLGRTLGWATPVLAELASAGLLHDLGKGRIPPEILFKPGSLDAEERRVIEAHPELGARVLLDNGESSALVLAATWGHHLRHDGGGYPRPPETGSTGRAPARRPGVVAELIHVCDVFEALTARRPYKRPLPPRRAFEMMLRDEAGFHPGLLAALVRTLGLYPPGSEVRLSDARRAVVVECGAVLDRPRLRVTHGPFGTPMPRERQATLDLGDEPSLEIVEIMSVGVTGGPAGA